jgi:hypothetical protein
MALQVSSPVQTNLSPELDIHKNIREWAFELNKAYTEQFKDILASKISTNDAKLSQLSSFLDSFSKKIGLTTGNNNFQTKVNALHNWFLGKGYYFNAWTAVATFSNGKHGVFSVNLIKIDKRPSIDFKNLNLFGFDQEKIPLVTVYKGTPLVQPFLIDYSKRVDPSSHLEGINLQSPLNTKNSFPIILDPKNGVSTQSWFDKTASNEVGHALFYLSDKFQNQKNNIKLNEAYGDYVTLNYLFKKHGKAGMADYLRNLFQSEIGNPQAKGNYELRDQIFKKSLIESMSTYSDPMRRTQMAVDTYFNVIAVTDSEATKLLGILNKNFTNAFQSK